jgi:peptide/nickel transport system substrate-binding protein
VRDPMGQMIRAIQEEITASDDRTVKWVLKKPYPKMLFALGKNSTPVAFVMPERIATSDPFKQISDYVGSGPPVGANLFARTFDARPPSRLEAFPIPRPWS